MSRRENNISKTSNILINVFFIFCTIACIYPVLLVLGVSFTKEDSIYKYGYSVIPHVFSLDAYRYVFTTGGAIVNAYGITIFVTVVGTILHTMITALFAYALSRKEFRYKKFFTYFIFCTMMFNGGMVPWYIVCVRVLHINNTIWALILPSLIGGWNVIILRTFFTTSIPDSIIESARIDGAGEFLTFIKIVLPLSLPGLATIALFTSLGFWNDWWTPLMLITKQSLYNLQFLLYRVLNNMQFLSQLSQQYSVADSARQELPSETARMAMCIISIGPIVLAYPFFQKYFVKGLTVGSVKG